MASLSSIKDLRLGIVNGGIGLYMVVWQSVQTEILPVNIQYRVFGDIPWIDVLNGLPVPISGVPANTPLMLVENAVAGTKYEIRAIETQANTAFIGSITMPVLLNGNNFLVADQIYNICGEQPKFLYYTGNFGVGAEMYNDILLTDAIDETLITQVSFGDIFTVAAGVVGASTGFGCYNWRSGLYVPSTGSILCTGDPVIELYTDGEVGISLEGMVLYSDQELTTPLTGNNYVLEVDSGVKYNLNSGTGEVGAPFGTCEDFYNVEIENNNPKRTIVGIFGIENFLLQATVTVGESEVGVHTAFEGVISISITGGGNCESCGEESAKLFINGVDTETLITQEGTYYFASVSFTGEDAIKIVLNAT